MSSSVQKQEYKINEEYFPVASSSTSTSISSPLVSKRSESTARAERQSESTPVRRQSLTTKSGDTPGIAKAIPANSIPPM
jgi:hypothetical protein